MSRIKKIMVAVDFSVYSVKIAKYARGIAEDLNAKLIFVNVINKRDIKAIKQAFVYHSENLSVDDYLSKLKDERAEKMQKLMQKTSCTNITLRVLIRTGIPFIELITAAEEEQVDIVIMGAKGRGDLAGMLFGSTAEKKCFGAARCRSSAFVKEIIKREARLFCGPFIFLTLIIRLGISIIY
jgi:nucleotide-binding universal stress UspA family protein